MSLNKTGKQWVLNVCIPDSWEIRQEGKLIITVHGNYNLAKRIVDQGNRGIIE